MALVLVQAFSLGAGPAGELAINEKGELPTDVRLFRAGVNKTTKGIFNFSSDAADAVIAKCVEYANDYCFDWAHSMLGAKYAPDPRKAAAAAGYFKPAIKLDAMGGKELWATKCDWTPDGADDLKNRRVRYPSPTFWTTEDGTITELVNVALTSIPATHGADPLMAANDSPSPAAPAPKDPKPMKTVIAMLNLAADSTEVQVAMALQSLQSERTQLLSAAECTSIPELLGKLAGYKVAAAQNTELSKKIADLEVTGRKATVAAMLDAAGKEGKVVPAELSALTAMGEGNVESLKGYLAVKPKVIAVAAAEKTQDQVTADASGLTADQKAVAKMMGQDPKKLAEFIATNGKGVVEAFQPKPTAAAK